MTSHATELTQKIDNEGYLLDSGDWSESIAENFSREKDLELSKEHWKIIFFMRSYYAEHLTAPDSRFVVKYLADELGYKKNAKKQLFKLFPYGYVQHSLQDSRDEKAQVLEYRLNHKGTI